MLKELDTYDWEEAFAYASGVSVSGDAQIPISTINDDDVSVTPFTREDVKELIAHDLGENDEAEWIALMELKDGRFAYLRAGCDYTGWD
jgi:hypothetical protein